MGAQSSRRRSRSTSGGPTVVSGSVSGGQHTSPLWLLATACIAAFVWFVFNTVQITSTIQAVLNFLQNTLTVTPAMTAQDLVRMQQGALGGDLLVANAIGWSVQIFLLIATFPSEHYIAPHLGGARKVIMSVLIGADWLTDTMYVLQGHTIFDSFMHFAPGAIGALVVAIIYPIAVTGVTVFCGIEVAHRVDRLFQCIRGLTHA
ncbi:MAG TPA: hypothetical protein VFA10_30240 [Ktedonobacteraceae bacterium]|nr:hypothetical protein [Ktedonobacteraceae bacterium]